MAKQATEPAPVILCGLGRVGREILCLLHRLGERITVITLAMKQDGAEGSLGEGVQVLRGDACDEALLARAGIASAKALIAATDDDLVNVTIGLHARRIAPDLPVVVRLFDHELGAQLQRTQGIRQGYSSSALAAPAFVAAAHGDRVLASFELGNEHWLVEELEVAGGPAWVGRSPGALAAAVGGVVLALDRGGALAIGASQDSVLAPGDRVLALNRHDEQTTERSSFARHVSISLRAARAFWRSTPRGLRFAFYGLLGIALLSVAIFHLALGLSPVDAYYFVMTTLTTTGYGDFNLQAARPWVKIYGTLVMVSGGAFFAVLFSMMTDLLLRTRFADIMAQGTSHLRGHVIVAGLGNTGFRVLRQLASLGEDVVAIEKGDTKFLGTARTLAPVVTGDAGAVETLQRAGLAGAKTVVAVTDDDLTNLSVALAAKQARPDCRVVARVFDHALATSMQKSLRIDAVVSVIDAVAPTFVGSAIAPDVIRGVVVRDHLLLFALQPAGERTSADDAHTLLAETTDGRYRPVAETAGKSVLVARWIPLDK